MESNIVNVYGYIRVSTEGQVKQGYSLAEQRVEFEKYCSSKSYNLIGIFKDVDFYDEVETAYKKRIRRALSR